MKYQRNTTKLQGKNFEQFIVYSLYWSIQYIASKKNTYETLDIQTYLKKINLCMIFNFCEMIR